MSWITLFWMIEQTEGVCSLVWAYGVLITHAFHQLALGFNFLLTLKCINIMYHCGQEGGLDFTILI